MEDYFMEGDQTENKGTGMIWGHPSWNAILAKSMMVCMEGRIRVNNFLNYWRLLLLLQRLCGIKWDGAMIMNGELVMIPMAHFREHLLKETMENHVASAAKSNLKHVSVCRFKTSKLWTSLSAEAV
jgi:hypothetical protein